MASAAPITGTPTPASLNFLDDALCWIEQAQGVIHTLESYAEEQLDGPAAKALYAADTLIGMAFRHISDGHSAFLKARVN